MEAKEVPACPEKVHSRPTAWLTGRVTDGPLPGRPGRLPTQGSQLGRAEARTGLRMMPTFPRPPRSFRTAGFPQYGWRAGLSSSACPERPQLKPAPGMRGGRSGLRLPCVNPGVTS